MEFRFANREDSSLILQFIKDLARYEHMEDQVKLSEIANERGLGRFEWWCLDWNKPSIDFYLSMGAEPMSDWTVYRIAGDTLKNLGKE